MTEEEKADARAAIEEEDRLAEEEAIRHAKREQRHARVLVALFSVALLWCSSFAVSDAIVEALFVIPHAPHDVLVNVNETYVHVKNAERLYAACATFQTKGCVDNVRAAARKLPAELLEGLKPLTEPQASVWGEAMPQEAMPRQTV